MKATIDSLKRGGVVLGAFLCATMGMPVFGAVDITDFIRSCGTGNYRVVCGNGTTVSTANGGAVASAFDGITEGTDGTSGTTPDVRVLLKRSDNSGPKPVTVLYYINDGDMSCFDFKVTSFTLYRLATGWEPISRSATQFKLEGYDGTGWHLLFETGEAQTWDENTLSRTYEIPAENQACYRTYLFTITANGGDASWSGFQELALHGDITRNALVWNGAEGARWNATDPNWLDWAGNATNWIPGVTAVFGAGGSTSITVEGTNDVGGLVFSQTNACTITGGALAMTHGFGITAGTGDVIASKLVDAEQVDVYQGMENGTRNYFPADPNNTNQGAWMLLWRNRNLAGITNFTGAVIRQGTEYRDAAPYNPKKDGDVYSVQFQCKPNAILCIKVLFVQIGADVYGRIAYVNYTWSESQALGDDFDGTIASRNVYKVYDGNVVASTDGAYGFYGVTPQGGEWQVGPLVVSAGQDSIGPSPDDGSFLPRSASDAQTGEAVLCFPGRKVADLTSVVSATLSYAGSERPSSMHFFTNRVTSATVQVQGNTSGTEGSGARICVKVELSDGVGGVWARAVYAKYNWDNAYAHDFDPLPASKKAKIYEGPDPSGGAMYGVANIVAVFKGDRLTLGTPALVLDHEIISDCTLRFAPLSGSQTVSVPVARTIDKVAFGGATTLSFAPGASLSVGAAEVEESAAVSITGEAGANLLRIGTSKCLASAERAHFPVNGGEATQDTLGWIVPKPGLKIILR